MNNQLLLRLLRERLVPISAGTLRPVSRWWLLALLLTGLNSLSWGQCFNTSTFTVIDDPRSVVLGDLNGDGKSDIATANRYSNNISVLLADDNGSFGPAISFPVGVGCRSVAQGDFNGDGRTDLVTANYGYRNKDLSVLLGNGSGGFVSVTSFPVDVEPEEVAIGDFNRDGKLDLVTANFYSRSVSILLGNGSGDFGATTSFTVGLTPTSVTVGDLNGDGKPDLVTPNTYDNTISVLLGNGSGGFEAAISFPVGIEPRFVAIGDLNGDRKLDMAIAYINGISILLGQGDGNFRIAQGIPVANSSESVVMGDFNGDGKTDLATTNGATVSVLLGNGSGGFGSVTTFPSGGKPTSVAVGDLNGDGKPDLATANAENNNISILYNCATPSNQAPTVANAIPPQSGTVGQGFTLSLANTFTDAQTPNSLTLSASGLPAGLSLAGTVISGIPSVSGVSTITVTATDPDNFSVSTSFMLTLNPASTPPGATFFAITGVTTVSCEVVTAGQRRVSFTPQYSGLTGETVTFSVLNELPATTAVGPYQLRLYSDNPTITLKAQQAGTANEASFSYNWLAACNGPAPANTAPTVANLIPNQSGTAGQGFSYAIPANTFADAETPAALLVLSASGLPAGLSFAGTLISGTPSASGVSTITVTATDPSSLAVSTSFILTVNPTSGTPPPSGFSITGVATLSCQVVTVGERLVSFTPQYGGLTGEPVSFSVVNELAATTAVGPYLLRLYTDNPVVTLQARQGSQQTSFSYNWLAACGSPAARLGSGEPSTRLRVTVLGNPVQNQELNVRVQGVRGQAVRLRVVDLRGYTVTEQLIEQATDREERVLRLGNTPAGLLLLQVSTAQQRQTAKVVKQ